MRGIVVVDQPVDDKVVIWQVNVGDGLESTMAGAWVLPSDDEQVDGLVAGRLLVATEAAAVRFGEGADVAHLAQAVEAEIDALDETFTAYLASLPSSRRSLVRPRWPRIKTQPPDETAGDPVATGALSLARWISDLLTAWGKVEKERLARPFLLADRGEVARDLPPGWATNGNEDAA